MGNNFDVIEQATFETLLSEHDRAEVRRLLERLSTLTRERDEAVRLHVELADALGYVNRPEGQGGYEVAEQQTLLNAIRDGRRAVDERDEARAALDEREADMHMRIRAGYDKTVADCWRAKVAEVERERDEALSAEHAAAKENEALILAYERLSEELSKPEDVRLREATEVMVGYAEHLGPSLADRISFELDEQDRWISRAGEAEREVEQLRLLLGGAPSELTIESEQRGAAEERAKIVAMLDGRAAMMRADSVVTEDEMEHPMTTPYRTPGEREET